RNHYTPAVSLAMAHRKEFEGRMLAILNPELRRRSPSRAETAALVGSLAVLALLVGAAAPVPRAAPPSPIPEPREPLAHSATLDTVHRTPVAADTIHRALVRRAPPVAPAVISAAVRLALDTSSAQGPGDDRAAVLAKTLRTDSSASVRRVAAWGLQRYARLPVAADALIAALDGDRDPEVREMAAWALAETRGGSAGAVLGKAVRQDKDPHVRETAVWALGLVRDPDQVPALVGALGNPDADVREVAAWAIGSNRPAQAPSELIHALGDHDRDVRLSAAWALYVIRDTMTVGALDAAFRRETDPEVQRGLLRALGAMGDRAVDALSKLVSSPDSEVRAVAVTALAGGNATGPWPWPRPRPRPFP
ncbi:MAG TPA: HEAT repeat domain-containing protein, partial [Gemmatimonadales bacterium]|nr:HEAT repeat domain-containing protein [Gemmatimonadales bacterium]